MLMENVHMMNILTCQSLNGNDSKNTEKDMIRINCTLYKFLRENMRTGISNMEDMHEMILWNLTCMFRAPMTTVLIQITSFFKSGKSLKVEVFWQKLAHNYMKTYSQFRWGNYTSASEFRFWIGGQNLADRLILSAKMKNFRKISIEK